MCHHLAGSELRQFKFGSADLETSLGCIFGDFFLVDINGVFMCESIPSVIHAKLVPCRMSYLHNYHLEYPSSFMKRKSEEMSKC